MRRIRYAALAAVLGLASISAAHAAIESPTNRSNDSFPTVLVLALAALGLMLGGVALASKGAVTRRRTRAAA